jgi:lactate permease
VPFGAQTERVPVGRISLTDGSELLRVFEQEIDPVFGSLALSAVAAALPILLLFVLLGVLKVRAPFAAMASLGLSIVLAIVGWNMPPVQALSAAAAGVFYGLFPILWILVNALWVYRLTVVTPWFEVFGRTIRSVSDDLRIM